MKSHVKSNVSITRAARQKLLIVARHCKEPSSEMSNFRGAESSAAPSLDAVHEALGGNNTGYGASHHVLGFFVARDAASSTSRAGTWLRTRTDCSARWATMKAIPFS